MEDPTLAGHPENVAGALQARRSPRAESLTKAPWVDEDEALLRSIRAKRREDLLVEHIGRQRERRRQRHLR